MERPNNPIMSLEMMSEGGTAGTMLIFQNMILEEEIYEIVTYFRAIIMM